MKLIHLLAGLLLAIVLCMPAMANPPHHVGPPSAQATSASSGTNALTNGDSWAVQLPSWGGSYAGAFSVCNTGWGWGFWWGPDMACVREIGRLTALNATPVPKPTRYPMADVTPSEMLASPAPAAAPAAAACIDDAQRARAVAQASGRKAPAPTSGKGKCS